MPEWAVIVNLITCTSGWKKWEAFLKHHDISYVLHLTSSLEEPKQVLSDFYKYGYRNYLFVGGDGTIHHCGNILIELSGSQSHEITIGVLLSIESVHNRSQPSL